MTRKAWTGAEVDFVLANRGRLKLSALARRLGRSRRSVSAMLVRYGHTCPKETQASWEPRLRALHAAGLCDSEIARQMGCARSSVWRRLGVLGLPPNPYRDWSGRYRRQMRNAEVESLAEVRWWGRKLQERMRGQG
jgi:AraC-like DNA-binding protein